MQVVLAVKHGDLCKEVETINRHGEIKIASIADFKIGYRHVMRPEGRMVCCRAFFFAAR